MDILTLFTNFEEKSFAIKYDAEEVDISADKLFFFNLGDIDKT